MTGKTSKSIQVSAVQLVAHFDRVLTRSSTVVRFQHKHYIPLTLALGLVAPTIIGWTYGDAMGGYIWGGVVARILIWHFTFFINSLAHYLGDQAYSEDLTARGNLVSSSCRQIRLKLTKGVCSSLPFSLVEKRITTTITLSPKTIAMGLSPSIGTRQSELCIEEILVHRLTLKLSRRWIIYALHHFTPFVPRIHQTPDYEILKARAHVLESRSAKAQLEDEDEAASSFARWGKFSAATEADEASNGSGTSEAEETFGSSSGSSSSSSSELDALFDDARLNSRLARRGRRASRGSASTKVSDSLPVWTKKQLLAAVEAMSTDTSSVSTGRRKTPAPVVLLLHGYAVDCTDYARSHPGGVAYLKRYAVTIGKDGEVPQGATEAFDGGLNDHGWSAREKMKSLRVARIVDGEEKSAATAA